MVRIKKEISISMNRLLEYIFPKREQYLNEKIIYYLRIYTSLVSAENCMSKERVKRAVNLMKIVRNMAKNNPFKEEEVYCSRIHELADETLGMLNALARKWGAPYHARLKMQIAQNICILRILKRERG